MSNTSEIFFHKEDISFRFLHKEQIIQWIKEVAKKEKKSIGYINYIFCSDNYLLELNKDYLNHKTLTDIITFDNSDGTLIESDIFISIERVRENAARFETTFQLELYRVLIHGVLHLCGYKDKKEEEKNLMREKENKYITLLNTKYDVPRGTK